MAPLLGLFPLTVGSFLGASAGGMMPCPVCSSVELSRGAGEIALGLLTLSNSVTVI